MLTACHYHPYQSMGIAILQEGEAGEGEEEEESSSFKVHLTSLHLAFTHAPRYNQRYHQYRLSNKEPGGGGRRERGVRNQCKVKKSPHHRRFTHQSINQSANQSEFAVWAIFRVVSLHFRRCSLRRAPPPSLPRELLVVMGHLHIQYFFLYEYIPAPEVWLRWGGEGGVMVLCVRMRFCWFPGMRVGAAGVIVLVFVFFPPLPLPLLLSKS